MNTTSAQVTSNAARFPLGRIASSVVAMFVIGELLRVCIFGFGTIKERSVGAIGIECAVLFAAAALGWLIRRIFVSRGAK